MLYERFSLAAFNERGRDSDAARELTDALQAAVLVELHTAIEAAFLQVVDRLNGVGHNLAPYTDSIPGDLNFHSKDEDDVLGLRLGLDTVASAGFAHFGREWLED